MGALEANPTAKFIFAGFCGPFPAPNRLKPPRLELIRIYIVFFASFKRGYANLL
jgi:hypothetical protein